MRLLTACLLVLLAVGCHHVPLPPISTEEAGRYAADDGFAQLRLGMTTTQVLAVLGPPTSFDMHITGKSFIPFAVLAGDTNRTVYRYRGRGRVTFTNPPGIAFDAVAIQIDPDPHEIGEE